MGFKIAIDGTGGSGKSTVAKIAAQKLGFTYIDTGAMYRAVGLFALNNNINLHDEQAVTAILENINIDIQHSPDGSQRLIMNGDDVTEKLRSRQAGEASSVVAVYPVVRERLVSLQKKLAEKGNVIMDGRDIGAFVLPEAQLKIYMDADTEIRALRRCNELKSLNLPFDYDTIKRNIEIRDDRDKNRKVSPLKKASGAVFVDTGNLTIDEAVQVVINMYNQYMEKKAMC